jgi:hypothetical protein
MNRTHTASFLYALALLLMPFSYAVKSMLELLSITWIPPTLVLGFVIFLLVGMPTKDKFALGIVAYAFLSATIGYFFIEVSPERHKSALYIIYLEPIRVLLIIIWFWVSVEFWKRRPAFVLRWLSISVVFQFLLAAYLYLGLYDLVPVSDIVGMYLSVYKLRQATMLGDTVVYRMAGTFMESPPFGVFMFSCLVAFTLWLARRTGNAQGRANRPLAILGATASLIGALASLSDQVFLALMVFGLFFHFSIRRGATKKSWIRKSAELALASAVLISIGAYSLPRVSQKWREAAATTRDETDTSGMAGAERMFHIRYGLQLLEENPLAIWTGIGPGRYGDYAVRTGQYPPDVNIQNPPVEWLVEFGVFGTGLIVSWLWNIAMRARQAYSHLAIGTCMALIIAVIGQGWLWEGWFLALAFLYCANNNDDALKLDLALC